MKTVVVSGYFDPVHVGHLEYLKLAKDLGDKLIVIVNNDLQRALKKSKEFMLENERLLIIKELKLVDKDLSAKRLSLIQEELYKNQNNMNKEYSKSTESKLKY